MVVSRKKVYRATVVAILVLGILFIVPSDLWIGKEIREENAVEDVKWKHAGSSTSAGELIVHVQSWAEGISHWTTSFSQVLVLCKSLNATLVEPQIKSGRLVGTEGNMKFSEIIDLDVLKQKYHPQIISLEEFQQLTSNRSSPSPIKTFRTCFDRNKHSHACKNLGLLNDYKTKHSKGINDAVASGMITPSRRRRQRNHMTVLEIHHLWVNALIKLKRPTNLEDEGKGLIVPEDEVNLVHDTLLEFTDQLHELVDDVLQQMGILDMSSTQPIIRPFAVVHWRADLNDMTYMDCAERIVRVKRLLQEEYTNNYATNSNNTMTFVLMTALAIDTNKEWGSTKAQATNTSAPHALDWLLDANQGGFKKVRELPEEDAVVNTAIDLVLAQRATVLTTCTGQCKHYNYCLSCNYRGHFAEYALELRRRNQQRQSHDTTSMAFATLPCWPQSRRHVKELAALGAASN